MLALLLMLSLWSGVAQDTPALQLRPVTGYQVKKMGDCPETEQIIVSAKPIVTNEHPN
jgi:hypothetical protein